METFPSKIIPALKFSYELRKLDKGGSISYLDINYCPLIQKDNDNFEEVEFLRCSFSIPLEQLESREYDKLKTLEKIIKPRLPSYELLVQRSPNPKIEAIISTIFCMYHTKPPTNIPSEHISATYFFQPAKGQSQTIAFEWDSFSDSQQHIFYNIATWVKKLSWEHLINSIMVINGQTTVASMAHKVFISYKKSSKSEMVAKAIASRLSQLGMYAWFDNWEIKAGDSIPGKIEEGFKDSDACIVFLTSEYKKSGWCTKEMNTALAKAINDNIIIIPSLVEECDVPELLKDLKRVDFIKQEANEFEQKLLEIEDAIYKVDLNPFRHS